MTRRLVGDWDKAQRRLSQMLSLMEKNIRAATKKNAQSLRDEIKRTIAQGRSEWPANAPLTIAAKGSSRPLVDHGDLMNSFKDIPLSPTMYFVGVPPGKKNESGIDMAGIAEVHEFGAVIKPKSGQALAVPVSREAAQLARKHGSVRNIPGLFRPHGTKVLALKKGAGFEIMFILMKETRIPPRPSLSTTFEDQKGRLKHRWTEAAKDAMRGHTYTGV